MSHKATRAGAITEDKDKRTDSPVKDMKKKVAANAEKEKIAAEKQPDTNGDKVSDKKEKPDKNADKVTDKKDKGGDKVAEKKPDKATEKVADKKDKPDKSTDKVTDKKDTTAEKAADKKEKDKPTEKKTENADKPKEGEKIAKPEEKPSKSTDKPKDQAKQNGTKTVHNGVSDVTLSNGGTEDVLNGTTVSQESDDDDEIMIIDENDELFPELTYDDTSDQECFEPPTPENISRSMTRRSQAKSTRTPETPRPASDKEKVEEMGQEKPENPKTASVTPIPSQKNRPDSKEEKKLDNAVSSSESSPPTPACVYIQERSLAVDDSKETKLLKLKEDVSTVRKLRSSDNQTPDRLAEKTNGDGHLEVQVVIEDIEDRDSESRKPDTNFSKSRVKVSPYRRSMRLADQTTTSNMADYTGNNTTMEMDITDPSFIERASMSEDPSLSDSYISGLRSIRSRRSYKTLQELSKKRGDYVRSVLTSSATVSESSRPTGTVVGRKRKPSPAPSRDSDEEDVKRARLFTRVVAPFRRLLPAATPLPRRREAQIVGINTDLPMATPVAAAPEFDPETLKPEPVAVPLPSPEDGAKRCIVM